RVPTVDGPVWFKENFALPFEPALTEVLARLVPDRVPEVVATEGARLLMRHAGPRLKTLTDPRSRAWHKVVARYAELQIDLAPVATGLPTPDNRPEALEAHF